MSFYNTLFQNMAGGQTMDGAPASRVNPPGERVPQQQPVVPPVAAPAPGTPPLAPPAPITGTNDADRDYGDNAPLRDFFDYAGSRDASGNINMYRPWQDPGLNSSGTVDWADGAYSSFDRLDQDGRVSWGIKQGSRLDELNQKYGGAFTMNSQPNDHRLDIDYSLVLLCHWMMSCALDTGT